MEQFESYYKWLCRELGQLSTGNVKDPNVPDRNRTVIPTLVVDCATM